MKSKVGKQRLLEALREAPIILAACSKAGVHKSTFYRWQQEDSIFAAEVNKALIEGAEKMCDIAQSNLYIALKNRG